MTDSLTQSDIDRIYDRLNQDVDLTTVTSKSDLFQKVSSSSKNKYWNNELNDFFYDIISPSNEEKHEEPESTTYAITSKQTHYKKTPTQEPYRIRQVRVTTGKRKFWTEDEINKAQNLKKNGLTHKQIASSLDRTPASISNKLSKSRTYSK